MQNGGSPERINRPASSRVAAELLLARFSGNRRHLLLIGTSETGRNKAQIKFRVAVSRLDYRETRSEQMEFIRELDFTSRILGIYSNRRIPRF